MYYYYIINYNYFRINNYKRLATDLLYFSPNQIIWAEFVPKINSFFTIYQS